MIELSGTRRKVMRLIGTDHFTAIGTVCNRFRQVTTKFRLVDTIVRVERRKVFIVDKYPGSIAEFPGSAESPVCPLPRASLGCGPRTGPAAVSTYVHIGRPRSGLCVFAVRLVVALAGTVGCDDRPPAAPICVVFCAGCQIW